MNTQGNAYEAVFVHSEENAYNMFAQVDHENIDHDEAHAPRG